MRNFKKILIAIFVLALLTAGFVVMAFAEGEVEEEVDRGSVAEVVELIKTAESANTAKTKYNAIIAVSDYLNTKVMDTTEEGYEDALVRIKTQAVAGARLCLNELKAEDVSHDDAIGWLKTADELLGLWELPDSTAGFESFKAEYDVSAAALAAELINGVDANIGKPGHMNTANNRVAINKVLTILSCTLYGEEDLFADVRAQLEPLLASQEEAVAKLLKELDAQNNVNNYDLPIYYTEDYETSTVKLDGSALKGWSFTSQGTANKAGVLQEKNGNKYFVHKYLEKDAYTSGSYAQMSLASFDAEKGLVFEFDVTTFGEIPKQGVIIETGSIDGSKFPPCYFSIDGNGNICANDKSTVLLKGAIVKGAWLHVIIVLEPDEFVYKLYVEGQFLGQYDAKYDGKEVYDHAKVAFRVSGGTSNQGEIAFDNFCIYSGNNYRDHDRLTNMTNAEKFLYYVDYALKETNPVVERTLAHTSAMSLIGDYWTCTDEENGTYEYVGDAKESEELQAAIQAIIAFDIDSIVTEAKLTNLAAYIERVNNLRAIARSVETVSQREAAINEIASFVKKNMGLIDLEADTYPVTTKLEDPETAADPENLQEITVIGNGVPDYEEMGATYNIVVTETRYDKNSSQFIKYINKFEKATTLSATQRYFDFAKNLVNNDGIDLNLILNESAPYRENFTALIEAYQVYLDSQTKVDAVTKTNNSYKIVTCIGEIEMYRTEEDWAANEVVMNEYLNIIKDIVLGKDAYGNALYDESYEGVDDAVRFFNRAYGYFYAILQDQHVEYLSNVLDLISATDSYVEKIGMIALIDRYVDTNDIDINDSRIATLLSNLDTCKSELELRSEDYSKVLKQNSVYFVNYVERMRTAQTYAEQVKYYDEAAILYFSLDITVEGSARAVEIFDEYKEKLDLIKECSVKFLEAVSIYNACEGSEEKYAALVECCYNAQFAEPTYEGVAEAMAEYKAAYDAYVNYANVVNADLAITGNAVGSVRTTCGITNIVAVIIKKIFGV